MSPAPMQMIMSPVGGEIAQRGAQLVEVGDRLDHAVAVGAKPVDQGR